MFKLTSVIVLLCLLTAVVGWTWKKPIHKFDKVKIASYLVGGLNQGDYDGRGQRSCKCNYVDFLQRCLAPMMTQLGLWLASWLS